MLQSAKLKDYIQLGSDLLEDALKIANGVWLDQDHFEIILIKMYQTGRNL